MAIEVLTVLEGVTIAIRGDWRDRKFSGASASRYQVVLDGDTLLADPKALPASPLTEEELRQIDALVGAEALAQHSELQLQRDAALEQLASRTRELSEARAELATVTEAHAMLREQVDGLRAELEQERAGQSPVLQEMAQRAASAETEAGVQAQAAQASSEALALYEAAQAERAPLETEPAGSEAV